MNNNRWRWFMEFTTSLLITMFILWLIAILVNVLIDTGVF